MPIAAANQEKEHRYREHFLRQDVCVFTFFAVIVGVMYCLLVFADHALWKGTPAFYGLLTLRAAVVLLAVAAAVRSRSTADPAVFDRWAFALAMVVALTNIPVILSRPAVYLHHINLELVGVVVLYIMLPDRLWYRVLPPVLLSADSLVLLFTVKGPIGGVGAISVVMAYVIMNALGIMISTVFHRYRRRSFFSARETTMAYGLARDSEQQYRLLVQNSHGIIYTIDSGGVFLFVSTGWTRLLGHEPSAVVGRDYRTFVHPDDIPTCDAFLRKTLETGTVQPGVAYRVLHVDGSYRWHLSNITPCFDDHGDIASFVGNAIDVTEQVRYEAELKEARRAADEANRSKSEFLALMGHEIRTPLNAILGFTALADQTDDPVKVKHYLDILKQSSLALMELVGDILDMGTIEAGRLRLDIAPLNLHELVWALERSLLIQAGQKGLSFRLDLDENVPVWVAGDAVRLRQILTNLLGNAVKFTETGGVVCTVVPAASHAADGFPAVCFTVQDTGIGIPQDKQDVIFEPFRQVDPGITRRYGGSGLGLAIVQRLTAMMGGQISVTSAVGEGSAFRVTLPLQVVAPPPETAERRTVIPKTPLSVLVVEDNRANRRLLKETLTAWGHRVETAVDGREALEMLAGRSYDLVLMDLRMQGMDGMETTRRMRELEEKEGRVRTPVIAVTADTETGVCEACRAGGIDAVLAKPAPMEALEALMAAHAGTHPVAAAAGGSSGAFPFLTERTVQDMGENVPRLEAFAALLREDISAELRRLAVALEAEDRAGVALIAHTLKGLCGHLRDPRPRALAARLQAEAQAGEAPWLRATARRLQEACEKTMAAAPVKGMG